MVIADYNDQTYDYTKYWEGRGYENQSEIIALKKLLNDSGSDVNRKIIDIGGGYGRLMPVYKDLFTDITIFDYSQKLLDKAQENANDLSLEIKTINGDVYNLSELVGEKYDCAVMVRVSHHLDDLEKVFSGIYKILDEKGVFILEIANKMHFKSVVSNLLKLNFNYFKKDSVSVTAKDVTFLNHHPKKVEELLKKAGFKIEKKLSVSNLRSQVVKKLVLEKILVGLEDIMQVPLSTLYFGPSIFYKLRKR